MFHGISLPGCKLGISDYVSGGDGYMAGADVTWQWQFQLYPYLSLSHSNRIKAHVQKLNFLPQELLCPRTSFPIIEKNCKRATVPKEKSN